MDLTRREFIRLAGISAVGLSTPIPLAAKSFDQSSMNNMPQFAIFSKPLQFLNYEDCCDAASEIGFDTLDLTVRPKGHVVPENVESELTKAVDAMKKYDMPTLMFTSNISDAENKQDQLVLSTAAKLGFRFYRPAWYKYGANDNIREKAKFWSEKLVELAQLSAELGITGSYQNRSGHYYGAPVWDLNSAFDNINNDGMGIQYDIMHNTIEGGKTWDIDFRLLKDKINTLVLKDFKWKKSNGIWDKEYVPLGEGMVDFSKYFKLLKKYDINLPITVHYEYDLGIEDPGFKPATDQQEVFNVMKKDLEFAKNLWLNS